MDRFEGLFIADQVTEAPANVRTVILPNGQRLGIVGRTEEQADEMARAAQSQIRRHEWDDSGERCIRCGDKDWMNTTCAASG